MIRLSGLQKAYGGRTVLDVPELTLVEGERYALIGANGSGKSTLLRILADTLRPDAGEIDFGGIPAGKIGYLPQKPYAFDLTVLENVMLGLSGSRESRRERAMAVLRLVELADFYKARGNHLSGGETQRMALARLLAGDWRLLLLDEPTAAADIHASGAVEQALLQYAEEHGCLLVFSSHAPAQALRLGTQAVVLADGRVAERGAAEQVLHAPKGEPARAFLRDWIV